MCTTPSLRELALAGPFAIPMGNASYANPWGNRFKKAGSCCSCWSIRGMLEKTSFPRWGMSLAVKPPSQQLLHRCKE